MSKNVPTDPDLYARVLAEAKKKFDVYPSAYANGWVVQEYKRRGGKYRVEKAEGGLTRWFEEKWVDISRPKKGGGFEPCGRPDADKGKYPKCVPASRAAQMTAEEIRSAIQRKRLAETKGDRDGKKPINVPTFKDKEMDKARFGSRSEAGRYAANMRWRMAGAGTVGNAPTGSVSITAAGTQYQIGLDAVTDKVSGAVQYRMNGPKGSQMMLQVFPDGGVRVINLRSGKQVPIVASLVNELQGKIPGVGVQTTSQYANQIKARINSLSRTASTGTIDTSGSEGKKGLGADTTVDEKLALTKRNTDDAIKILDAERVRPNGQYTAESVMKLMDDINIATNRGLVPPGTLMRTGDSTKYPYTKVVELQQAKRAFAEDLARRLNDPNSDPVETAAMIHWKVNFTDHFYEDGVGRSTEVLAALPLMRAGRSIPSPSTRDEWFSYGAKENGLAGFPRFLDYYRSLT